MRKITIGRDYFEHLLACLANQKFIDQTPINGEMLDSGKHERRKVQIEHQATIDKAWKDGMDMLVKSK